MAFELAGIPYHMDEEYAAIIGQLTHPDSKSHSIDSFIQSDHLFHLDHRGRPLWWNGSLFMVSKGPLRRSEGSDLANPPLSLHVSALIRRSN